MKTYRLPDGTETPLVPPSEWTAAPYGTSWVEVRHPTWGPVRVLRSALEEVKPPLPAEPKEFSTVRVGVRAYVRDDCALRYLRYLADTATDPDSWVARIDPTPERFPWIARVLRALATEYEDVRALSARLGRD